MGKFQQKLKFFINAMFRGASTRNIYISVIIAPIPEMLSSAGRLKRAKIITTPSSQMLMFWKFVELVKRNLLQLSLHALV